MNLVAYLILIFGVLNLLRMTMFLVGSDIYGLHRHFQVKKIKKSSTLPKFSVIIPAHNEEKTILRNLKSIYSNDYPKDRLEVVFVDDGSTDKTLALIKDFKKTHKLTNLSIVSQKNSGKASALNNGLKNHVSGKLVMCLDADSYLAKDSLRKAVAYFDDKRVMAVASNVKIIDTEGLLNLVQKFEYIICYQMKRAQTIFNIEYIIGGIGSTFRYDSLKKVGFYDGNTVTEDIDLTMKILREGNKANRVVYGADVIAYTESVLSLEALISQRFRWKYGRTQTFWKNKKMFFNRDSKYSKGLTFFYLPFAIYSDIAFFFEPLLVTYILFLLIKFGDLITLLTAFVVISAYISINILAEDTIKLKDKVLMILLAPTMYFLFYILSFVEYVALIKTLVNLKDLKKSLALNKASWQHVERSGTQVS